MSVDYPDCAIFYYNFNDRGVFFGASPEKILSKENDNIAVDALAGSASIKEQNLLLHDEKINAEIDRRIFETISEGFIEDIGE